eukprot:TRINITY_DN1558_c5_g1_i1.p2 TRINITY_DN1558_c5_g1~~TRINITY_DN1558_c5_g1_i1.p2  ORF type:complete len:328 (+),score=110.69 TRINITY_DN1558_c5_g1_i1:132-1115(+)
MEGNHLYYYVIGILSALGLLSMFIEGEEVSFFEPRKPRSAARRTRRPRRKRQSDDLISDSYEDASADSVDGSSSILRSSTPDVCDADEELPRSPGVGQLLSPHRKSKHVFTSAELLSPVSSSEYRVHLRRSTRVAPDTEGEPAALVSELRAEIDWLQQAVQTERAGRQLGEEQVKAESKLRQDSEEAAKILRDQHEHDVQKLKTLLSHERNRVQMLQDRVHVLQTRLDLVQQQQSAQPDARPDSPDARSLNESTDSSQDAEAAGSSPPSPPVASTSDSSVDDVLRARLEPQSALFSSAFGSYIAPATRQAFFWETEERSTLLGAQSW